MKIKIVPSTKEETDDFEVKEWHGLDLEHYGKTVHWHEKDYRFVARDREKIVGLVFGKHSAGVVYIDDLIVAATSRGKGIGKLLLDAAEDFGRQYKAHKTHLITGEGWKANDFYLKNGFKEVGRLQNHHFHRTFVIYEREIKY